MLYDLLLRGGRVIDPSQSLDGAYDVAIREGRIAAIYDNKNLDAEMLVQTAAGIAA